ncbi:MAG: hypothetical protein FWD92_02230 [Methanomassiliicoccaceae archaeon]|nr:hypothetical protein [Methanomassiliicoccaceae archaeon]
MRGVPSKGITDQSIKNIFEKVAKRYKIKIKRISITAVPPAVYYRSFEGCELNIILSRFWISTKRDALRVAEEIMSSAHESLEAM